MRGKLSAAIVCICFAGVFSTLGDDDGHAETRFDSIKTYASISPDIAAIRDLIAELSVAWNRHDIPGYMKGLWNSPDLLTVTDGQMWRGWSTLLDTYQRGFRDPEEMGQTLDDRVQIELIDRDNATVLTWSTFTNPKGKKISSITTLQVHRLQEGWRVIASHSTFLG